MFVVIVFNLSVFLFIHLSLGLKVEGAAHRK